MLYAHYSHANILYIQTYVLYMHSLRYTYTILYSFYIYTTLYMYIQVPIRLCRWRWAPTVVWYSD